MTKIQTPEEYASDEHVYDEKIKFVYLTEDAPPSDLELTLNVYAERGWRLHTVFPQPNGMYEVIFEGALR